jgi:hypothetical protein
MNENLVNGYFRQCDFFFSNEHFFGKVNEHSQKNYLKFMIIILNSMNIFSTREQYF